ncbi:MAG: SGNH/GDSL hydrolase family protein [Nitrospirae bacterium]|nr:SGNH/GDSL hydrolase family protein [Nitrospirota bacterium]
MTGAYTKAEKAVAAAGILMVLAGVVGNEWLLTLLFSPDGELRTSTRIIVWATDLLAVGAGLSLVLSSIKHQVENLALLFVTTLVCLFLTECVVRLIEPKPLKLNIYMENPNGTGSFRLKPDIKAVASFGKDEIAIETNSYGMRWREVSLENRLQRTRIAVVGDSFAFGLWADRVENGMVGVFETMMDKDGYEVLNFGVPGYGPPDIELQVREEVLAFKPDYLVLLFYSGNDFKDAYLGKDKYDIVDGVAVWNKENQELRIPPEAGRKPKVRFSLATFRLLNDLISKLLTGDGAETSDFLPSDELMSDTFWSRTDRPEIILEAKDLTMAALDNIRKACYNHGIRFVIVSIPYKDQVFASSPSGENYDIRLPQGYVEEYARKHSIPYLDLLPVLRAYVRDVNRDIYAPNDIHFNNEGHYVVGKAVAGFFRERVLR